MIFRKEKIIDLCKNKTVLHLGFIQHSHLYRKLIAENKWLHQRLAEVASYLVGLDYLYEDVNYIRDNFGYVCYYADVTKLNELEYREKFDIIVCGELIEHLENPGLMLDKIKEFMNDDSLMIITTPNPWSRNRLKLIKQGKLESEWLNPEHVCWFSFSTLKQLLKKKGYKEVEYSYYYDESITQIPDYKWRSLNIYYNIKNYFRKKFLPEHYYGGLFFVSKIDTGSKINF